MNRLENFLLVMFINFTPRKVPRWTGNQTCYSAHVFISRPRRRRWSIVVIYLCLKSVKYIFKNAQNSEKLYGRYNIVPMKFMVHANGVVKLVEVHLVEIVFCALVHLPFAITAWAVLHIGLNRYKLTKTVIMKSRRRQLKLHICIKWQFSCKVIPAISF